MADVNTIALRWTFMEPIPEEEGGGFKVPENPHWKSICHTGITLNPNRLTAASNAICGSIESSRGRVSPSELGIRPQGGYNFELELNQFAGGLPSAFYAKEVHREMAQESNRDGESQVAGVVGSDKVVVVTPTKFVAGDLVRLSGFDTPTPGVYHVQSSNSDGLVFSGLTLKPEVACGPGAVVKLCGKKLTIGLNAANKTLSGFSSAANFTEPGSYLYIKSVGMCRVAEVDATTVTFDSVPATFADAVGLETSVYFCDIFRDGSDRLPIAIEQQVLSEKTKAPWYVYWLGLYANTVTHTGTNTEAAGIVTGSVDFVGVERPEVAAYERWPGSVTVPHMGFKAMNNGTNVKLLRQSGVTYNAVEAVTSHTYTSSNNISLKGGYGSDAGFGVTLGDFAASCPLNTYMDSPEQFSQMIDGRDADFGIGFVSNDGGGVVWDFPNASFQGGAPSGEGRNATAGISVPIEANLDERKGYTQTCCVFYGAGEVEVIGL